MAETTILVEGDRIVDTGIYKGERMRAGQSTQCTVIHQSPGGAGAQYALLAAMANTAGDPDPSEESEKNGFTALAAFPMTSQDGLPENFGLFDACAPAAGDRRVVWRHTQPLGFGPDQHQIQKASTAAESVASAADVVVLDDSGLGSRGAKKGEGEKGDSHQIWVI